jgi:RTX calcium-binding nonapeptide repeat (4 copies)
MKRLGLGRRRRTTHARGTTSSTALALALLAAMALPSAAPAASVSVDKERDRLVFAAAAGERNAVSVSALAGVYTITDGGSSVGVGTGCTSLGPAIATCTAVPGGPIGYVLVSAGDGDDSLVAATPVPVWVDGGGGADFVKGGGATDFLYGGAGDDVLDGGPGADTIAGGDGHDRADYSSRTAPLIVTLDGAAGDGETGEGDNLTNSIEEVTGGAAGDRLTGGSGANVLSGGAGSDTLSGGGGGDMLDGGSGKDTLDGGAEADVLRSADGEQDDVRCGTGQDAAFEDPSDMVAADCEARQSGTEPGTPAARAGATLDLLPKSIRLTTAGTVRVRIYCALPTGFCTGRVSAGIRSARSARVGAAAAVGSSARGTWFSVRAGESKEIKVTISRNGRRRVLREKKAKCRISATTRSAGGSSTTARKTVIVRAPKRNGAKR